MLERFVELKTSTRKTLGLIDNSPKGFFSDDWRVIKELIHILHTFEEATKAVSGSNYYCYKTQTYKCL
jgi:hypothetical protein